MELFSERENITQKQPIQLDSMDDGLKNRLWNAIHKHYFEDGLENWSRSWSEEEFHAVVIELWDNFFKLPVNFVEANAAANNYKLIREQFNKLSWNRVYDLIDHVAVMFPKAEFVKACNNVLEQENSGYRFVAGKLAPITNNMEIDEIEKAVDSSPDSAKVHLNKAIELLSKKPEPDDTNSAKESISAVESICKIILKNDTITLSSALGMIEGRIHIHPRLREAYEKIYSFASSSSGIRHGLSEEDEETDHETAQYLLISCSAFINYLIVKCSKAGIKL